MRKQNLIELKNLLEKTLGFASRYPTYQIGDRAEACARKPVQVKIPQSQYDKWMSLPVDLRNQVLKDAIEKVLKEKYSLTA